MHNSCTEPAATRQPATTVLEADLQGVDKRRAHCPTKNHRCQSANCQRQPRCRGIRHTQREPRCDAPVRLHAGERQVQQQSPSAGGQSAARAWGSAGASAAVPYKHTQCTVFQFSNPPSHTASTAPARPASARPHDNLNPLQHAAGPSCPGRHRNCNAAPPNDATSLTSTPSPTDHFAVHLRASGALTRLRAKAAHEPALPYRPPHCPLARQRRPQKGCMQRPLTSTPSPTDHSAVLSRASRALTRLHARAAHGPWVLCTPGGQPRRRA